MNERNAERGPWVRGALAVGVLVGYAVAFALLHPLVGNRVLLLGLIPALVIGWTEGLIAGIVAGLITVPLNTTLIASVGLPFRGWGMLLGPDYAGGALTPLIVGGAVGRMRDMGRLLRREREGRVRFEAALADYQNVITRLIKYDVLTGLPNRNQFRDQLGRALAKADERNGGVALLLIDLDRFREINDTLGHDFGDQVLLEASRRVCECLDPVDYLARLGGDEFVILIGRNDERAAVATADRILCQLRQPLTLEGQRLDLDASIGLALSPGHGNDPVTLLRRAETAMYVAKADERRRVVYSPEHEELGPQRLALLSDLRESIAAGRLALCFQPKVDLHTRQITGAEALVRWPSPHHGLLPPGQFLPMAEVAGLLRPITAWVLGAALDQCRQWHDQGLNLNVSVNLSCSCLHDPRLADMVLGLLQLHQVRPSWLTIEVTEDVVRSDEPRVRKMLARLRKAGVSVAIDDFGTGYSSLTHLKELPADEMKVDRSFISSMAENPNDAIIVSSVVDLAHKLGLRVVAEGVEDRPTLEKLAALGCDVVQGYYLCKPLPAEEFREWMGRPGLPYVPRQKKSGRSTIAPARFGTRSAPIAPKVG